MQKICTDCGGKYEFSAEELKLFEHWGFDPASTCFVCNQKHRISFRNGRNMYKRKCDATGEEIISIYSQNSPYKIYKSNEWYNDKWDSMDYGRTFDFNRPFFDQFQELRLEVPRMAMHNVKAENSDFCNQTYGNKNCYMIVGGDFNEDSMYGTLCMRNRSLVDGDYTTDTEMGYMMSDSIHCYNCRFTFDSKNCSDCSYISNCTGCKNCILCTNLSQKSYCIRNKQLTKEDYNLEAANILTGSAKMQKECVKEFVQMRSERVVKYAHMIGCEHCTGDYQQHSKNCINCYDILESEDLHNVIFASKSKDCFQCSLLGDEAELCYESISSLNGKNVRFSHFVIDSIHVDYSDFIFNCQHVFGCEGLRHKKYCILNKQYTKEEYEELIPKIIEHMKQTNEWGKFFPKEFSCFAYNESTISEYFPLSREEALAQGFKWREESVEKPKVEKIIPASQLPDSLEDIPDDILNWGIECEITNRPFKITPKELSFYRKMNIPIPRKHPDERYSWRTALRNPRKLWKRQCQKCDKDIQTTYSPERTEKVLCEKCYLKEVY